MVGERIRQLRKRRGWRQEDLAKRMNISRVEVSNYECGKRKPPIDRIQQMASIYGISVAGILDEEIPPRSIDTLIDELKAEQPIAIPVLEYESNGEEIVRDYVYWTRAKVADRNIMGFVVKGFQFEPEIGEGDIVFVDTNYPPEEGCLALALINSKMVIGRYRENRHRIWLECDTGQHRRIDAKKCTIRGVVIQVNKAV